MAETQERASGGQHPDLLAAVVLHTLVSEGFAGISAPEVARICERDPADAAEMLEIDVALDILLEDGLARRVGEVFRPTRAAVRASELEF